MAVSMPLRGLSPVAVSLPPLGVQGPLNARMGALLVSKALAGPKAGVEGMHAHAHQQGLTPTKASKEAKQAHKAPDSNHRPQPGPVEGKSMQPPQTTGPVVCPAYRPQSRLYAPSKAIASPSHDVMQVT